MGHDTTPGINRAGRRLEARRLRKAGAALAAVPTAFGAAAAVLGAAATPAGAAVLTVLNTDATGAGSLHDLAESAVDGDVIVFAPSVTGTITLTEPINVDASITVQGPGAGVLAVSGNDTVQIFDIAGATANEDVVISGLTLTQGKATYGGAISFANANLTVRDAVLTDNEADEDGGAINSDCDPERATDSSAETLTIENSTITGNTAGDEGGGICFYVADGTFTMTGSTLSDNTSTGGGGGNGGGGAWIGGTNTGSMAGLTITDSTITGNTASGGGGGLYVYYVDAVTITDTTISGNTASGDGGGLFVYYVTNAVTITDTTISDNTAEGGGGGAKIGYVGGTVTVERSTISGNSSTDDYGGGLYLFGIDGQTTIAFTTIADNSALDNGGGIVWYENDGDLVIRNSTISGNTTGDEGGGMFLERRQESSVSIYNSTISGNTAQTSGGGIHFANEGGLTIVQSTIAANTAPIGGGVFVDDDTDSTSVAAADAKQAERDAEKAEKNAARAAEGKSVREPKVGATDEPVGAAEGVPGDLTLSGTIVALNSGGDIGETGTATVEGSLIGSISGTTLVDQGGNLFDVDPLLGPLADNGGPTKTHALLDGSPAINTGPDPLTPFPGSDDDQRGPGYPRVIGGRVDIGAFEVQPTNIEPTFTG